MNKLIIYSGLMFICIAFNVVQGQQAIDTLRYSAKQAEELFLSQNIPLIAEKLNIDQGDARILQAKAWPNPTFTVEELQVYKNSTTDKIPPIVGNFWRDRNFGFQLEQLVQTAGKRRKNIALEMRNKSLAENNFRELLLALKAEFRQNIAEIRYIQRISNNRSLQLTEIDRLLNAQKNQYQDGNISQADLFRIQSFRHSIAGEIRELKQDMNEKQANIKNMMAFPANSFVVITGSADTDQFRSLKEIRLDSLMLLAAVSPMLRIAESQVAIDQAQFEIEKANRVPDVTILSNFDRNGSTMRNFVGVGATIDLPIFNRNKGNIRAARIEVNKSQLIQQNTKKEIDNQLVKSWTNLLQSISVFEEIDKDYIERLDELSGSVSKNFAERNISLLQFLDYYESFRESAEQYYDIIRSIENNREELGYLVGTELQNQSL